MGAETFDDMQGNRINDCDTGFMCFNLLQASTAAERKASSTSVSRTRSKGRVMLRWGVCAVRLFNRMEHVTAFMAMFADFMWSRTFHAPILSFEKTRTCRSLLDVTLLARTRLEEIFIVNFGGSSRRPALRCF